MIEPKIELKVVDRNNWITCIRLKLKEDQMKFIAPNLYSIAQSKVEPNLLPYAIYANKEMIGFALVDSEPDPKDLCHWIPRFMIDASFQGQGYGKASMKTIIEQMKTMTNIVAIRISFDPDNDSARALYLKMGFMDTGEIEDDEVIFEMRIVK
ncbi:hypothetical protein PMSD_02830 [Paenibacillus macquariensis subsp. defensor]|nr:hypothetical protein PMSD_02830 [Paenibacillus macquariensis subsp. defensor]